VCPRCQSENSPGKRYCSDCGNSLDNNFEVTLQRLVKESLDARLKDQKVLEIETAQAIVSRLKIWSTLFGFFVLLPLGIVLGVLGINSYEKFTSQILEAQKAITPKLDKAKSEAGQAETSASDAHRKAEEALKNIDQINKMIADVNSAAQQVKEQVSQLSGKLQRVEVRQDPTIILGVQKRLKELGYYRGILNGTFDNDTYLAIVAYQRHENMTPDGYPGPVTLRRLGIMTVAHP
jgi:hypothetical protein